MLALFLSALVFLPSPSRSAPPSTTINRPTSDPYQGNLQIFEGAKRAENLQIDRVMNLLGLRAGSAVADIGAGGGWFSVRAARRVGPQGVVYAEDIYPPYLKAIKARARKERLPNVRPILGEAARSGARGEER